MQKVYRWLVYVSVVILSIFLLFFLFQPKNENKGEIKIATGSKSGMYYQYALEYQKLLRKEQVEVVIVPTAGSKEAQKLLHEEKVDIAFIQGGTIDENISENLESLASIYLEPLWVFSKASHPEVNEVSQLLGKRIAIGLKGSGTEQLVRKLLKANGITEENAVFVSLDTLDAQKALVSDEIDILFTVISPSSDIIKGLLTDKKLRLMNMRRTEAYALHFPFLTHFSIPEGSVDLQHNIPSQDIKLISSVATLAVHKNFPPELIRLFLREVKQVHENETLFATTHFPSERYLELPINKSAALYLEKGDNWLEDIFPYWVAYNINHFKLLLIPILTLLLPLFKGVMPFYQWRIRRRIYRWYKDLVLIESTLLNPDSFEYDMCKEKLEVLLQEILNQTKVPLSYSGELYDLKMHIEFVLKRIEKEKKS